MAYKSDNYKPNGKNKAILDAAWDFIEAVPYKVSTRWLFYQLLQSGYYRSKDDYHGQYVGLLSKARHNNYQDWRPDSLVDDRRETIIRAGGYETIDDWIESMSSGGWSCNLDHFYQQDHYVELWYEAEAMSRQFQYYTQGINLVPFSGHPSISYKHSIAKALEDKAETYGIPIIILYFGDYDQAGMTIPESAIPDIQEWCNVDFEVIRCGLNEGDEIKYNLPENIDKPGAYQWEALSDKAAAGLIESSTKKYLDLKLISGIWRQGLKAEQLFNDYVRGFPDYYQKMIGGATW